MFKSNNAQKGLLFILKITNNNKYDNFTISRINLNIVEPADKTFITNKDTYYFIDYNNYQNFYDIFIFSSNGENRIKYYYSYIYRWGYSAVTINEGFENKNYLLINDYNIKYTFRYCELLYIHIDDDNDEKISLNFIFLKKNIFYEIYREVTPIELCYPGFSFNEVYYLAYSKYYSYSYLYKEIFGKFEAYYLNLTQINSLDDIFYDKTKWEKFNSIFYDEEKSFYLFHFKCLNNNPSLFNFIELPLYSFHGMREGSTLYYISKHDHVYQGMHLGMKLYVGRDFYNISVSFQYIGCSLEEDDLIKIDFGENQLILNKDTNYYLFNNINIEKGDYPIYSSKLCGLEIKFGNENYYPLYSLEEYNNETYINRTIIFFKYPKIKEDNHYILEFFRNNNTLEAYCRSYYDDIRNTLSYDYIEMDQGPHNGINSEIRTNPYKIFENDSDLT